MIPSNRCEDADGAGQQTPHSCPQHQQKEDCLAVQRSLHFTPTHQATCQLRSGMELKQDLTRQAAWPQECDLPGTECLLSHSKCHSGALPPKMGHPNSSARGTEDPALGGTRGGEAGRWHCSNTDSSNITLISKALQQERAELEGTPKDTAVHGAPEIPGDSRRHVRKMWTSS